MKTADYIPENILNRYGALLRRADHPGTSSIESANARRHIEKLETKHAKIRTVYLKHLLAESAKGSVKSATSGVRQAARRGSARAQRKGPQANPLGELERLASKWGLGSIAKVLQRGEGMIDFSIDQMIDKAEASMMAQAEHAFDEVTSSLFQEIANMAKGESGSDEDGIDMGLIEWAEVPWKEALETLVFIGEDEEEGEEEGEETGGISIEESGDAELGDIICIDGLRMPFAMLEYASSRPKKAMQLLQSILSVFEEGE